MLSTAKIKEMSTVRLIITPNTLCLISHLPCCSLWGKTQSPKLLSIHLLLFGFSCFGSQLHIQKNKIKKTKQKKHCGLLSGWSRVGKWWSASILQHRIVHLVDVLRHFWSPTLQRELWTKGEQSYKGRRTHSHIYKDAQSQLCLHCLYWPTEE